MPPDSGRSYQVNETVLKAQTVAVGGEQHSVDTTLHFTGERLVPGGEGCEPLFARKMYQEHSARYLFAAQVCSGKRVLDVGCGAGYGPRLLAEAGAARVVAFDVAADAIEHAKKNYQHSVIDYRAASAENFEFGEKFDVVTSFELIEHVDDPEAVLRQISQHMTEGSLLFMSTPRRLVTRRSDFHTKEFSLEEFRTLLEGIFPNLHVFVENNHFVSLVTAGLPTNLRRLHFLEPGPLALESCDTFMAVGSKHPIPTRLEPVAVLNDDEYVKLQERDVGLLQTIRKHHEAVELQQRQLLVQREQENAQRAKEITENEREITELTVAKATLVQENQELRDEREQLLEERATREAKLTSIEAQAARLREQLMQSGDETKHLRESERILSAEVQRLSESRSWRYTRPLRESKKTIDALLNPWRRALHSRRRGAPAHEPSESHDSHSAPQRVSKLAAALEAQPTAPVRFGAEVIFVIGCHDGESKRYRVYNVQEALEVDGVRTLVFSDADIPRLVEAGFEAKALVLFRAALGPNISRLISEARRRRIRVFLDIDDLIFEPENIRNVRVVQTFNDNERRHYLDGVRRYRQTLLAVDEVVCPTKFLASRAEALGKPASVIQNTVNARQVALAESLRREPRDVGTVRIGYFSGTNTHQIDFQEAEGALLRLLARYPQCRFLLVGTLALSDSWTPFLDRVDRFGFQAPDRMLDLLAQTDINIAPVEVGNPYCESKSQLKVFEAGLVCVPSVASATASFGDAVESGVDGFLAVTEQDWFEALERLVLDPKLRREIGQRAHDRALRDFGPNSIAHRARQVFLEPRLRSNGSARKSAASKTMRVSWIIPGLPLGSGGHRNILRAAYYLERFGHEVRLYFTQTEQAAEELAETVREHFYPIDCRTHRYNGKVDETDVLLATHWSTVDTALTHREDAKLLAYFIQDFEPMFYPMGSDYVLAENTYRQGLYHLTLGPWCAHILENQFGVSASSFEFPIDASVYRPGLRDEHSIRRVLFFARPEMPRRCFEIGLETLRHLNGLEDGVEIVLFGSASLKTRTYPFPAKIQGLVLDTNELAQLYRGADVGISFSTTNPSSVGYEMMACGLPVVDIGRPGAQLNYAGRSDIALLADARPQRMALEIQRLLRSPEDRGRRSMAGIEMVKRFPDDEESVRGVETLLMRGLANVVTSAVTRT